MLMSIYLQLPMVGLVGQHCNDICIVEKTFRFTLVMDTRFICFSSVCFIHLRPRLLNECMRYAFSLLSVLIRSDVACVAPVRGTVIRPFCFVYTSFSRTMMMTL